MVLTTLELTACIENVPVTANHIICQKINESVTDTFQAIPLY